MLGIIPLRSAMHAEFLHHEVPGMKIPAHIQQRMRSASDAAGEGVAVAVEFLDATLAMRDRIAGIYVMPPRKKNEMIVEILQRAGLGREVAA